LSHHLSQRLESERREARLKAKDNVLKGSVPFCFLHSLHRTVFVSVSWRDGCIAVCFGSGAKQCQERKTINQSVMKLI
jgi:hypothetical protein